MRGTQSNLKWNRIDRIKSHMPPIRVNFEMKVWENAQSTLSKNLKVKTYKLSPNSPTQSYV